MITGRGPAGEAPRGSGEQFRALLELAPDAVAIADEKGQIVFVNHQTETLFGYEAEELLGQPVETLLPERFRDRHVAHRADFLAEPRARPMGVGLELFGRRKDGTEFPVDVSLSALATEQGTLLTAFVRDVTERKAAELALAKAHAELEQLYVFARRLEHESELGPFADALLAELCDITGCPAAGLYLAGDERRALDLHAVHGLDEGGLPAELEPASQGAPLAPLIRLADGRLPADELRLPLRRANRTLGLLVLARAGRAFAPDERKLIGHLADDAALALANVLALRRASRQAGINKAVLDAAPVGIYLADTEGTVLVANSAVDDLAPGRSEVSPLGRNFYELAEATADQVLDPAGYRADLAALQDEAELQAVHEYELAGSGRSYRRYTGPVRNDSGALIGRIFVIDEATAERAAERLRSELLATVSHELRTPLAGILGLAELLARRELDAKTRRTYAETIHSEAGRLTGLVNTMLDLQRIAQGALALAPEPFDLGELLAEKVRVFAGQSEAHSLELALPAEPLMVVADREQIGHVVGNLLSNAIKYSPDGGPVHVEGAQAPELVRVSVRDEGIGIPSDQQGRIFEKFFRVSSAVARRAGGNGLGLALCRGIVNAHGGRIDFDSEDGRGSTFWFELPVRRRAPRGGAGLEGRRAPR